MTDISNLEKLGTELKCPICLSLLNCSVSLTCNHVFCNTCIGKSMKSASGCPVCKVPFHRREIRPAPNMDSLVAIYKNMEVASGVQLFVSQTVPSTQEPGNEDEVKNDKCNTEPANNLGSGTTIASNSLKKCKRKGSNRLCDEGRPNTLKPSFPTKKRVQVPQHPAPETPTLSAKSKHATYGTSNLKTGKKATICENGEPVLTPFFWLREEEETDKSSQHTDTDGGHSTSTPPDAPCFSDIKESDDDLHSKRITDKRDCMAAKISDFNDSEMFEWTQRPSSPELCSSMALQDEDTGKYNDHEANVAYLVTGSEDKCQNKENKYNGLEKQCNSFPSSPGPLNRVYNTNDGTNKTRKRVQKETKSIQKERVKRSLNKTSETLVEPTNHTDGNKENLGPNINSSNLKDNGKIRRTICARAKEKQLGKGPSVSNVVGPTSRNEPKSSDLSILVRHKEHEKGICTLKNGEEGKCINPWQDKSMLTQKRRKLKHCSDGITPNEAPNSPLQESKSLRRVKFAEDYASKGRARNSSQNLNVEEEHETARSVTNIEIITRSSSSKSDQESNCETISNAIQCAFCQSTEESEASGVIVHFFKGKTLDGNWNGGAGVIHAHKRCTEWAPNVYFQDDNVINLESELARSRRIKCGLCGIKGAALGCYDRSCHRSFHVPCAKLTPQCRWDHVNFVMLCPLHVTSMLPSEEKKGITKRCHHMERLKPMDKEEPSVHMKWKSHEKSKDMVLCCSALSDMEKGSITEFERLAGLKMFKNWNSSVTHVIASTDNNGACRRTLKYLMGVLEGKWILSIEWVRACMDKKQLVDEKSYEIKVDIHGIVNGPRLGRMRLLQKQPKLFAGCKFYFMGDFANPYKRFLHDLVVAAGGAVLNRKPISEEQTPIPQTFIIYSVELPEKCDLSKQHLILDHRKSDAEDLAGCCGAVAVSNTWILNSISGSMLQCLP